MRLVLRFVVPLLVLPLIAAARAPRVLPAASAVSPDAIRAVMRIGRIPGAELLVLDGGSVVYSSAFGVKDITTNAPVDVHTRFEIGSITKQFTAAAIMQLVDAGKLSLSDPLGKYIEALPQAKNVTIRQLLWQVSGIPNYTEARGFKTLATSKPGTFNRMIALVADKPLNFKPGTRWEYSNTNYVLLGRVIERASGMPWARYVRTHIFTPAGMTESSFIEDEPHIADMATGYKVADARTVPAQRLFPGWAYAAGGIVSTASDIAKWDLAFFSGRIVPMADVKTITTASPLKDKSGGYGFGWSIDRHDGVRRFWHNGGTFGYLAINEVYPTLSQAFIVLQNSTWLAPDRIGDVVFNELHPELAAAAAKPEPGEDPVITARIKEIWSQFFRGHLDRNEFDAHANAVQTPAAVAEESSLVKALGEPQQWAYAHSQKIGKLTVYDYQVWFTNGILMTATMALSSGGKVSMFLLH